MSLLKNKIRGQVLIEILIIIGLFSILISGIAGVVSLSGRAKQAANYITNARAFLQQYREALFTLAFNNWSKLDNLDKSSTSLYYLYSTSGSWEIAPGRENFIFQERRIERYFYVEKVWRYLGNPTTTNMGDSNFDPSTLKFTIVVDLEGYQTSDEFFLSKWKNSAFFQSAWGGGPGFSGPINFFSNYFSTSLNIKYDDEKIQLQK